MSELGDALELLHDAHRRYRAVRLVAREWRHNARLLAAYHEAMRAAGAAGVAAAHDEGVPEESEVTIRAWFEQPNRVREERGEGAELAVAASDGARWWTALPGWATIGEEGDGWSRGHVARTARALLDPARLPGVVELTHRRATEVAGRAALLLGGAPRPGIHPDTELLGTGADRHQLAVDAERGVLLAVTSFRSGEPFSRLEVVEIAFDEQVDRALFSRPTGAGEDVLGLHQSVGERVTIEEAARRAAFTVLAPTGLGLGWQLHVLYTPAVGAMGRETVTLSIYRDDATHTIAIRQTRPPFERWQLNGTEPADRDGRELRLSRDGWRRVLVEQAGTAVEVSSATVEADELVELALALQPAPTGFPPLVA